MSAPDAGRSNSLDGPADCRHRSRHPATVPQAGHVELAVRVEPAEQQP